MGVFKQAKASFFIWLGFLVFGAFDVVFGAVKLHYVDKSIWSDLIHKDLPDYYNLIYVAFFFSGIGKIIGFLPKLNNMKLIAFINIILHAVMLVFAIVGMIGIKDNFPGFENLTDKGKAYNMNDAVLLFGSSVGVCDGVDRLHSVFLGSLLQYQEVRLITFI